MIIIAKSSSKMLKLTFISLSNISSCIAGMHRKERITRFDDRSKEIMLQHGSVCGLTTGCQLVRSTTLPILEYSIMLPETFVNENVHVGPKKKKYR